MSLAHVHKRKAQERCARPQKLNTQLQCIEFTWGAASFLLWSCGCKADFVRFCLETLLQLPAVFVIVVALGICMCALHLSCLVLTTWLPSCFCPKALHLVFLQVLWTLFIHGTNPFISTYDTGRPEWRIPLQLSCPSCLGNIDIARVFQKPRRPMFSPSTLGYLCHRLLWSGEKLFQTQTCSWHTASSLPDIRSNCIAFLPSFNSPIPWNMQSTVSLIVLEAGEKVASLEVIVMSALTYRAMHALEIYAKQAWRPRGRFSMTMHCDPCDDLRQRDMGTDQRPRGCTHSGTEESGADYAGHNTSWQGA